MPPIEINEPGDLERKFHNLDQIQTSDLGTGTFLASVERPTEVYMLVWVSASIRDPDLVGDNPGAQLLNMETGWVETVGPWLFPLRVMRSNTTITMKQVA